MANCKYCGKPAGLLKNYHRECETRHHHGIEEMERIALQVAMGQEDVSSLEPRLTELARASLIPSIEIHNTIITGWEKAVDHFLDDGILDSNEESRLEAYAEKFNLEQKELNRQGYQTRIVKAAVLQDVMAGTIPERLKIEGDLGLNFQKSEKIIWLFQNTDYCEDKVFRRYEGGSTGASVRIAKGLYFRTSSFRGNPVDRTEKVHIGTGNMVVTNKNIYFIGSGRALRIPYKKILSITPFEDGIGIQKDGAKDKPQLFITNDGWFTYNLVTNVSHLLAE